jgi:hypothetical protein
MAIKKFTKKEQIKARKLWVKALRSGEYMQCTGKLAEEDYTGKVSYCCLGVACELAIKAGVIKKRKVVDGGTVHFAGNHYSLLPPSVKNWLGLADDSGLYQEEIKYISLSPAWVSQSLASKNDAGASFATIAEIIESEPKGLLK